MSAPDDPILRQRERFRRVATVGQRVGYLCFGAAVVLFVIGFATRYSGGLTGAIAACLIVGSVVLAPTIVLGYAVRAADREDRERTESP